MGCLANQQPPLKTRTSFGAVYGRCGLNAIGWRDWRFGALVTRRHQPCGIEGTVNQPQVLLLGLPCFPPRQVTIFSGYTPERPTHPARSWLGGTAAALLPEP